MDDGNTQREFILPSRPDIFFFRNYYVPHAVVVYNDYYRVCDVFEIYYYPIFQKNHTH